MSVKDHSALQPDGRFTLLGDLPNVEEGDPLGFNAIAVELKNLVLASRHSTPFTFGINAGWGMGKSSLMQQLRHMLDATDGTKTVWFNAWTSEGQNVLEGLIKSVLDQVDPNILRRTLRKRKVIKGLKVGFSVLAGWLRLGGLADEVWKRMAVDPRARNEIRELMVSTMNEWMDKRPTSTEGRLLVVFIDDLDRCSPGNVLQVFEAIKLYLDAPGFVFVIGYDPSVVTDAILEQKQYGNSATGREYLEKIIQITYRIQQPDDEQVEKLMASCVKESRTAELFNEASPRTLVIERNARNPRRIKRFINGFILEYGLDREWESLGAESLVKVQILQTYFPTFAQLFDERARANPLIEFLDYLDVRGTLRRQVGAESAEWTRVEEVFESHGLGVPTLGPPTHSELLHTLEQELPESFAPMAQDENFVSLVRSMGSSEELERLRRKLERRRAPATRFFGVEPFAEVTEPVEGLPLRSLKVLWIDDKPEDNLALVRRIETGGAEVAQVRDYEEATGRLQADVVNVIISDISRGGDEEAGFKDIERLRTDSVYQGPVMFYTGRITPARRKRSEAIGALAITNDPVELWRLLQATARPAEPELRPARVGPSPTVLIGYRRQDGQSYAGRLYDGLVGEFGQEKVFMDVESLSPGADLAAGLSAAVASSDALLEIVGPDWLSATDSHGTRAIDDPADPVRVTLLDAMKRGKMIIPVLVGGAVAPSEKDLPQALAWFARRQALEIGAERWRQDVDRLVEALRQAHGQRHP